MPQAVEELVAGVKASVEGIVETNKQLTADIKAANEAAQKGEAVSKESLEAANKAAAKVAELADNIVDMEQKLYDNVVQGKASPKTLGQLVIQTSDFKNFIDSNAKSVSINIQANTITGQDGGSPARNSDVLVAPDRLGGIVQGAFRNLTVKQIFPGGTTLSNSVEYTREVLWTNNAAETAEGYTKPESANTFELKNANVATIAHFIKLSKQVREDAPALAAHIDNRMRYGVEYRVDNQILNGDGTSQNIEGLLVGDNYTAYSPTAGDTEIDSISRMQREVDGSDFAANFVLINPQTWGDIERIKGTDDHYVIGNPLSPIGPVIWGLPVVVSNAMPLGKSLVGNAQMLAQTFDRTGVEVQLFEQDGDNVTKNLLTVRAEQRMALAVYRPASCRYGALVSPGASA